MTSYSIHNIQEIWGQEKNFLPFLINSNSRDRGAGAIESGICAASDSASAAQSMPLDADDASSMPEESKREGETGFCFFWVAQGLKACCLLLV